MASNQKTESSNLSSGSSCLWCNNKTSNPKFCSLSCSVSYNNKHNPKRKWRDNPNNICKCGNRKDTRVRFCNKCRIELKDNLKKPEDVLGMSVGGAFNRLRKLILFDLIKRLGLDNCYRCNEKIDKVEQSTIEHKIPWLVNDSSCLFWDLENIAFSHFKCNIKHKSKRRI